MSKKLTAKQKREYVASGGSFCPKCKSSDIDGQGHFDVDSHCAWQSVRCITCGFAWDDIYTLTDIEVKDHDAQES